MNSGRILILMGGGLDSSYLVMYMTKKSPPRNVIGLHYDYGQHGAKYEWDAIKSISNFFRIDVRQEKIRFPFSNSGYEVLGRNLYFILASATIAKKINCNQIALGIHKGTNYYDCSQAFVKDAQKILDGYFHGDIQLNTPLINLQKNEIFKLAKADGLPIHPLYSCDMGQKPICGKCPSCKDWMDLNAY